MILDAQPFQCPLSCAFDSSPLAWRQFTSAVVIHKQSPYFLNILWNERGSHFTKSMIYLTGVLTTQKFVGCSSSIFGLFPNHFCWQHRLIYLPFPSVAIGNLGNGCAWPCFTVESWKLHDLNAKVWITWGSSKKPWSSENCSGSRIKLSVFETKATKLLVCLFTPLLLMFQTRWEWKDLSQNCIRNVCITHHAFQTSV